MHIQVPGGVYTVLSCNPPMYCAVSSRDVEIDSAFQQTHNREYNNVCHCKLLSNSSKYFRFCNIKIGMYTYYGYGRILAKEDKSATATRIGRSYISTSSLRVCWHVDGYTTKGNGWAASYVFMTAYYSPRDGKFGYFQNISASLEVNTKTEVWTDKPTGVPQLDVAYWSARPIMQEMINLCLDGKASIGSALQDKVIEIFDPRVHDYAWSLIPTGSISYWAKSPDSYTLPNPGNMFLLHEDKTYFEGVDPMLQGKGLENYWSNVLIQNSYLDAIQSVPRMSENSISNILEIGSFIYTLVVEHRIEFPKSLADAWLAYRYQYGTTKLDIQEAVAFVGRHADLEGKKGYSCYGSHSINYKGTTITARCGIKVRNKVLDTYHKVLSSLYTYGLAPGFYVIWDMIPYSFIVDWFLPIGKVASVLDAERMYSREYFDIYNVGYSFSYSREGDDGYLYHLYTRWLGSTPPELSGFYFLEPDTPSNRTLGYRALDAASLILG